MTYTTPTALLRSWRYAAAVFICGALFSALPATAQNVAKTAAATSTPSSVHIEADRLEYQVVKPQPAATAAASTLVLTGKVKIRHLQSNLTAERVEVDEGNPAANPPERSFDARGSAQQLAHFNHQAEATPALPNPAPVSGQAIRITYNAASQTFVLLGQAELWQGRDHLSAETIRYFAETGKYFAESSPATANKAASRVRIEFFPATAPGKAP